MINKLIGIVDNLMQEELYRLLETSGSPKSEMKYLLETYGFDSIVIEDSEDYGITIECYLEDIKWKFLL